MTTATLAPRYNPSAIETDTYRRWLDGGVFHADVNSQNDPYVIVIPPPNVTDVLHSGHGLNNALQDVLIRFERMRGREACWLPGTDHAGIATQNVVERMLVVEGTNRHEVGREALRIRLANLEETDKRVIDSTYRLANTLMQLESWTEAEPFYRATLEGFRRVGFAREVHQLPVILRVDLPRLY